MATQVAVSARHSHWAGEFKVVRLNKSKEPGSDASMLQANYALKRAGETVTLSFPDGRVIDKTYAGIPPISAMAVPTQRTAFLF